MKQHRVFGTGTEEAQEYYEQTVVQVLRPKLVTSIACAQSKTLVSLADGNVFEFPRGQLPRVVEFPDRARGRVISVAAGDAHFVALTDHLVWNVYTWGQPSVSVLGRALENDASASSPRVVRDLPGKVNRVSCGSNYSLCGTVTGDLWAFGADECSFGQSITPGQLVVKLPWGSEGERDALRQSFSACGRFGLVYKVQGRVPSGSSKESEPDNDGLLKPSTPSPSIWFEPVAGNEALVLKHALEARDRWEQAAAALQSLGEEAGEVRTRVAQLRSRAVRHELQTETDARVLVPFAKSGDYILPAEEAFGPESTAYVHSTTASRLGNGLEVRRRQVHYSRIRDGLNLERLREREHSAKDAEVCARRLAEGVALLDIIKRDAKIAEETLARLERAVAQAEVSAREWRTQAILLERALLRLKRARLLRGRGRGAIVGRREESRVVYPAEGFGLTDNALSLSESGDIAWVRARLDPDWGKRLRIIRLDLTLSNDAQRVLERILLNPVDPLSKRGSNSRAAVIQAKTEWNGRTCAVHLRRHAIFEVTQAGEDAFFYIGIVCESIELARTWMEAIKEVAIRAEGDAKVAAKLKEEVEEKGAFAKVDSLSSSEWDRLVVEVAAD